MILQCKGYEGFIRCWHFKSLVLNNTSASIYVELCYSYWKYVATFLFTLTIEFEWWHNNCCCGQYNNSMVRMGPKSSLLRQHMPPFYNEPARLQQAAVSLPSSIYHYERETGSSFVYGGTHVQNYFYPQELFGHEF